MRAFLLISLLVLAISAAAAQRTARPLPPAPEPAPTRPAQPAPRAQASSARGQVAILVTDPQGAALAEVRVEAIGPTPRDAQTATNGRLALAGLLPGTYRLRFTSEAWTPFEREVTVRSGQTAEVDAVLTPAPEPSVPPPPPEPVVIREPSVTGPVGQPLTVGIVDLLDREFVGRQDRRESLLSCSGNQRATMIQMNEPLPPRLYESADVVYYVLAGSGTLTIAGRETRIETNGFVSVPRGTLHGFSRRGGRPLVVLAVVSGEPCQTAQ
jgi:hypothetical protein